METAFKCVYMGSISTDTMKDCAQTEALYLLDTDVFLFYQMLYKT